MKDCAVPSVVALPWIVQRLHPEKRTPLLPILGRVWHRSFVGARDLAALRFHIEPVDLELVREV